MGVIHIRARTDDETACLLRELAPYQPTRDGQTVFIEYEQRSDANMLAVLSAVETCLIANDIRSVHIELDGEPYLLAPT